MKGTRDVWSVRISLGYRALGRKVGDDMYWYWIGDRRDLDRIV